VGNVVGSGEGAGKGRGVGPGVGPKLGAGDCVGRRVGALKIVPFTVQNKERVPRVPTIAPLPAVSSKAQLVSQAGSEEPPTWKA